MIVLISITYKMLCYEKWRAQCLSETADCVSVKEQGFLDLNTHCGCLDWLTRYLLIKRLLQSSVDETKVLSLRHF